MKLFEPFRRLFSAPQPAQQPQAPAGPPQHPAHQSAQSLLPTSQPAQPTTPTQQKMNLCKWLMKLFKCSSAPQLSLGPTTHVPRSKFDFIRMWISAYFASIVIAGTIMPILASLTAVKLYLALPLSHLPSLPGIGAQSPWYTFVWTFLITGITWLVVALPFSWFCTARGANPRNYGLFRSRLHQLNSYLGITDYANNKYDEINDIQTVMKNAGLYKNNSHLTDALKEAYDCCIGISRKLCKFPTGLSWIIGTAYNKAWNLIHHAEEVIIEIESLDTAVRDAKHDFLAICDSDIKEKDSLIEDIRQAVGILKPEALVYFKPYQASQSSTTPNQQGNETTARGILREVRSTLNQFRDRRWEGLVRQRSRLLTTMGVTGIVTYALLSIIILKYPPSNPQFRDVQNGILAATIFYAIGAIVGLFTRLYYEAQARVPVDDFGLTNIRLVATPLLSGLAGIIGVLFTVIFTAWGGTAVMNSMPTIKSDELLSTVKSDKLVSAIFSFNPAFWSIAAIFGIAPNSLIKALQEKANQYQSEIQSSTATESTAGTK